MKLKNLVCALPLIFALNVFKPIAEPGAIGKTSFLEHYNTTYTEERQRVLQLNEKNSSYSIRIVLSDGKAGLINLLYEDKKITFVGKSFGPNLSVKEVQVFDIANKILNAYFSDELKKPEPNTEQYKIYLRLTQKYENFLWLIKDRFLIEKPEPKPIRCNFSKLKPLVEQETIEGLMLFTLENYSQFVRNLKKEHEEQTLESVLKGVNIFTNPIDYVRLVIFYEQYKRNLSKETINYELKGFSAEGDFVELPLVDKNAKKKGVPENIKAEMYAASAPASLNTKEIKDFLDSKEQIYFFKYDEFGNYYYGGFKWK